jgi:hypothetical protein
MATATPKRRSQAWPALLAFVLATLVLGAAWSSVSGPVFRLLARPVAHALDAMSTDIAWVDVVPGGGVELVLENNKRKDAVRALGATSKLGYAVLASLLLAAFVYPRTRDRFRGRAGILRVLACFAVFVASHVITTWLLLGYVIALECHGRAPGPLRLAGTFIEVLQNFVPFILVGLFFTPRREGR